MMIGPSKFTSIRFLEYLTINNFISAGGREYDQQETEQLLLEKKCVAAQRYEAARMKELHEMANPASVAPTKCKTKRSRKRMKYDKMTLKQIRREIAKSDERLKLIDVAYPLNKPIGPIELAARKKLESLLR